jgi:hypothetical protein
MSATYIMVIMMFAGGIHSGGAVTTQEFYSESRCKAAAEIINTTQPRDGKYYLAMCVMK